jgi:Protein of unknown function (DUF1573)
MKIAIAFWLALAAFSQAAGLEFENLLQELKAPADATTVTADFKFTNKGNKPVTISKSDPGCSCIKVQISGGKLKYAPGESGVVRTTFEMGNFSGTVDKAVGIWLDDAAGDKPSLHLTVRVQIPVLVALEPTKTLSWDVGGKPEPKTIRIRMAEGQSIKVTGITCSPEAFSHEIKTVEEGKLYDLTVTPLSVEGPKMSIFRIETDCKIAKHRVQQAFAVVRKPVAAQAARP